MTPATAADWQLPSRKTSGAPRLVSPPCGPEVQVTVEFRDLDRSDYHKVVPG